MLAVVAPVWVPLGPVWVLFLARRGSDPPALRVRELQVRELLAPAVLRTSAVSADLQVWLQLAWQH